MMSRHFGLNSEPSGAMAKTSNMPKISFLLLVVSSINSLHIYRVTKKFCYKLDWVYNFLYSNDLSYYVWSLEIVIRILSIILNEFSILILFRNVFNMASFDKKKCVLARSENRESELTAFRIIFLESSNSRKN